MDGAERAGMAERESKGTGPVATVRVQSRLVPWPQASKTQMNICDQPTGISF
jgi:hypothetical protein